MNEAAEDMAALNSEEHTVWVLSTAGQGDMPHNGEEFWTKVQHGVLDYSFFPVYLVLVMLFVTHSCYMASISRMVYILVYFFCRSTNLANMD